MGKRLILVGVACFMLFIFFGGILPILLIKVTPQYTRHVYLTGIIAGTLFCYVLIRMIFAKSIEQITKSNLQLLRLSGRLKRIYILIAFVLMIIFTYYSPYPSRKMMPILGPIFIVVVVISTAMAKKKFEFNCPHCSKLLQINISGRLLEYLDCSHCHNKIKFEIYKGKNKYLYALLGRSIIAVKASELPQSKGAV